MPTLSQLLASLPEEQRIILTAHYLRGKSVDDIATMLTVPQKSVEAVIALGKAELLKAIQ